MPLLPSSRNSNNHTVKGTVSASYASSTGSTNNVSNVSLEDQKCSEASQVSSSSTSRWRLPHYRRHHKLKASISSPVLPQSTDKANGNSLSLDTGFNATSNNALDDLNESLAKFKGYMHQSMSENPSPVNSVGTSSTNSTNVSSMTVDMNTQVLQSKFSPNAHHHHHHHHHHHRTSRVLKLFKYKHNEHGSCSSDDISTCKEAFGNVGDDRNIDVQANFESLKYQQQASELKDSSKQKKTKRSYSSRILHYATGNTLRSKSPGTNFVNDNEQTTAGKFSETAQNDANFVYHKSHQVQGSKSGFVVSPSVTSSFSSISGKPMLAESFQSKSSSSPYVTEGQLVTSFNNQHTQSPVPSPVLYNTRAGSSPLVDQSYGLNKQVYSRPTSALKRSKSYTISDPPYSPYGFNHTSNRSFAATADGTSPVYAASTLSASSARFGDSSESTFSPVLSRFSQAPIIHSPLNTSTSAFPNAQANIFNNKNGMTPGSTTETGASKNARYKRSSTFGETSLMNMQQHHLKQGLLAKNLATESRSGSNTNTNVTCNSDTQDENELFEYGETESAKNIHLIADADDDENDASVAFNRVFSSASNSFSNLNLPSATSTGTQFLDSVPTPHTNKYNTFSAASGAPAGPVSMSTHSKTHYISRRKRTNTCGSMNSRASVSTNASSVVRLSPIRRSTSPNRCVGNTTLNPGSTVSSLKSQHQQQQHWSSISSGSSSIMSSNVRSNSSSNLLQISTASSIITPNTATSKVLGTDTYSDQNTNMGNHLCGASQPLPPVPQLLSTHVQTAITQPMLQLPSSVVTSSKSRKLKSANSQKTEKANAGTQDKHKSFSVHPGTKNLGSEMQNYSDPSEEYLQPPNSATTITSTGHSLPMDDERTVYSHSTTTPVAASQGSGLGDVGEDPEFMNLMSLMEITHPSSSEELSSVLDGKSTQNTQSIPQATVQGLEDLESELDLHPGLNHKDGEHGNGAANVEHTQYFTNDALDRHKDDVLMFQDDGMEDLPQDHKNGTKHSTFIHTHSESESPLNGGGANESDEMMQMMLDLPELREDFDEDYFLINEMDDLKSSHMNSN
ncbi:hypothetical protein ACO0QE_002815 [Hanseniaspora vineae]